MLLATAKERRIYLTLTGASFARESAPVVIVVLPAVGGPVSTQQW